MPIAKAIGEGAVLLTWIGFALSIGLLLLISRRNIALGMAVAAAVLALFTLTPSGMGQALLIVGRDPSVWLLALVVSGIPIIGGLMERYGEMTRLVSNLRIGLRPFLVLAPALVGLLPMPGGTLLSAPMVERGAGHAPPDVKAALNVWFRHTLVPVYPLGAALIASAKIAGYQVYDVIPAMVPVFVLGLVLGWVSLLRRVDGQLPRSGPFSWAGLLIPLSIILIAPLIDLVLKYSLDLPFQEIGTAVGVVVSLGLSFLVCRPRGKELLQVVRKMKPWKYGGLILAMLVFLEVFLASGLPDRIAGMTLPPVVLGVVIGFALGLVTGRTLAPVAIVIPIYLTSFGPLSTPGFAVIFGACFLGFMLSPIHPCVSVSLEYFGQPLSSYWKRLAVPSLLWFCAFLAVGFIVL